MRGCLPPSSRCRRAARRDQEHRGTTMATPTRGPNKNGKPNSKLTELAAAINKREGTRKDQLQHARDQGRDLEQLHAEYVREFGKDGGWELWPSGHLNISASRVRHYRAFWRWLQPLVTSGKEPDAELQWRDWQRVSGNLPKEEEDTPRRRVVSGATRRTKKCKRPRDREGPGVLGMDGSRPFELDLLPRELADEMDEIAAGLKEAWGCKSNTDV